MTYEKVYAVVIAVICLTVAGGVVHTYRYDLGLGSERPENRLDACTEMAPIYCAKAESCKVAEHKSTCENFFLDACCRTAGTCDEPPVATFRTGQVIERVTGEAFSMPEDVAREAVASGEYVYGTIDQPVTWKALERCENAWETFSCSRLDDGQAPEECLGIVTSNMLQMEGLKY